LMKSSFETSVTTSRSVKERERERES